jgi:hypothetical protein
MTDSQLPSSSAAPTPPIPRPTPAAATRGRLELPTRGNEAALRYALGGVAFYIVAAFALVGALLQRSHGPVADELLSLFGLGKETNFTLTGLILLGILVVVLAVRSVVQDWRDLAGEEEDVEWVNRHGRDGLGLVFAPAGKREALFRRGQREYTAEEGGHVETLMDDRVRRLMEKAEDAHVRVSPDELRAIAETRTARYGAFARYASSLLLLLAVLGTFAGVKTALPGLIDAVSGQGAGRIGSGDITVPLRAVADAFGGNALALVGAIAVGLMAQGLSIGRRSLLERLELVSTEFLYGGVQGGSVDPLLDAVSELSSTARSVREAGLAIAGVEDAITALGATFNGAFDRLNAQLVEVAERQDEALHERTSSDLRELQRRVVDLAGVVEQNTRGYLGIVDTVDERARESRAAIDLVRDSAGSLQQALQSIAAFQAVAQSTAERVQATLANLQEGVQQALGALLSGSEQVTGRMEVVAANIERAQPAIATVEQLLRTAADRVSTIDERASAAWSSAASEMNTQLGEVVKEMRGSNGRATTDLASPAGGRDPELTSLLRRVAAAVEAERGPSPRNVALAQGVGTLAGLGAAYLLYHVGSVLLAWLR